VIRLEDVLIFVCTADSGSLSAAARQLNVTPAVASAALKRLEQELGARLLTRSTRSLRLTPDGERYLIHARKMLAEVDAGRDALAHDKQVIGGEVSLSMPSDLGRNLLAAWIDEFQSQHPQVTLKVCISDRIADMFRQPVDLAVRYGKPDDSTLIALPLVHDNRRVLCASPAYFARHGKPQFPADLVSHNCLKFSLSDVVHEHWTFYRDDAATTVSVSGNRASDDGELVRRWAVDGRGIAYKSRMDVLHDLRSGVLEAALTDYLGEPAPLSLICTHRLMISPTVYALRDFLQKRIDGYIGA
jgi:DNA-binding transcriptional LysR family regulator